MRVATRVLFLGSLLVILPAATLAQTGAALTGIVSDSSGAVLPGVTVEAKSPVLIEQTRSAVSDETGRYRIVDLRPGTYSVTFTLPGFAPVIRQGIELSGTFVANVDAQLRVGGVAESVTVTGETPVVDTQSTKTQETLSNDVISSIPSGRQYFSLTALVPALNVQGDDVGASSGPIFSVFQAHGGRRDEGQIHVEGLSAGFQGLGVSGYVPDVGTAQEVNVTIMGGMGEATTGGPVFNIMPKVGGNEFHGTFFANGSGAGLQASNYSQALQTAGLRAPNKIQKLWDVNGALGGPIKKDKLWFYWTIRYQGNRKYLSIWDNKNAGDITKWTYNPDFSHQALDDGTWKNSTLRLTWEASKQSKINVWWDEQTICLHCNDGGDTSVPSAPLAPEATHTLQTHPLELGQLSWNYTPSSRIAFDSGFGWGPRALYGGPEPTNNNRSLIRVQEQAGIIPGIVYRAPTTFGGGNTNGYWSRPHGNSLTGRSAMSYITGAHNVKVGGAYAWHTNLGVNFYNDDRLSYTFTNGAPTSLTMYGLHGVRNITNLGLLSLFAQDQWTLHRVTLQGGLRFEHIGSNYPAQTVGPDRFIPNAIVFPAGDAPVSVKDLSLRFGAAWDVFGNGKTAVRGSLGRYPSPTSTLGPYGTSQNPLASFAGSTNRAWNNYEGDFIPHCDLMNPAANGTSGSKGPECGGWSNPSFGKNVKTLTYDPNVLKGWNIREFTWDLDLTLQQQIAPRVSVSVGYVRRVWGNWTVTHNRATAPSDYTQFTVPVPQDSRLPGGGGYTLTGIDINPDKFIVAADNFVSFASNYGTQIEHYNGLDVNVNARLHGLTIIGGTTSGRKILNNCAIVAKVPEVQLGGIQQPREFCDLQTPFLTALKGLATYTVPHVNLEVAGTFQSKPTVGQNFPSIGSESLAANWLVPAGLIQSSLGRPLSSGSAFTFVNIVKPGTLYQSRINQFDFRVAKLLRFEQKRLNVALDFYNIFNSNVADSFTQTYGNSWLAPLSILPARFAKIGVQFDF
jgi:hypothetical protein